MLAVVVAGLLATAHAGPAVAAPSQGGDPTVAPATTLSPDGRTATDGARTLTVSQAAGLAPTGQVVSVAGRGFDTTKGIYVALCVIPPTNLPPSPCGGGVDTTGQAGSAHWVSSDPPPYADGLTEPYGPGGSFSTSLPVSPAIGSGIDCRSVRCAIVTRNDHTRPADRSQDVFIPVTFAADPGPGTSSPPTTGSVAPPPSVPTTPTTPVVTLPPATTTTAPAAPESVISDDGRTATAAGRSLRASAVEGLDPAGARVQVSGEGYDPARGVYVGLCAAPTGGGTPGPCLTGDEAATAWISSDPPAYGRELARPYGPGGAFEVTLTIRARIDEDTDCRRVACALVTRRDDTAPHDRAQDVVLPVRFADEPEPQASTTTTDPVEAAADDAAAAGPVEPPDRSTGSTPWPWIAGGAALTAVAGGGVVLGARRRRSAGVAA